MVSGFASAWLIADGLERLRSAPPGVRSVEARALVDARRHDLQEPLPDLTVPRRLVRAARGLGGALRRRDTRRGGPRRA